ncbi:unnamed protein product, partial [Thlaspi arvense]
MIKRRFYKLEHGDKDSGSDSSCFSSDSDPESEESEESESETAVAEASDDDDSLSEREGEDEPPEPPEEEEENYILGCMIKCKSVYRCRYCPKVICLNEKSMQEHILSKKHVRLEKLLKEEKLSSDDDEEVDDPETLSQEKQSNGNRRSRRQGKLRRYDKEEDNAETPSQEKESKGNRRSRRQGKRSQKEGKVRTDDKEVNNSETPSQEKQVKGNRKARRQGMRSQKQEKGSSTTDATQKSRKKQRQMMIAFCLISPVRSSDVEALLSLKSSIDPSNSIPWRRGEDLCNWEGVKGCINGRRVSKLVLENLNLTGSLDEKSLNQLDQLRVLSFKGNSLSASVPNLSGLVNLKSIFLNENNFSGEFPESLTSLHRLKTVVLAGNRFSGPIPGSLSRLSRLYTLYLQDNLFSGSVPPLNQTTLRFFNVSNNHLSGQIPPTRALNRFNESSFTGNTALCGEQIQNSCRKRNNTTAISSKPSAIPAMPMAKRKNRANVIGIISGSIGGGVVILLLTLLLIFVVKKGRRKHSKREQRRSKAESEGATVAETEEATSDRRNKRFSWERGSEEESVGTLVFLGRGESDITAVRYTMDDLLKASAETLGRGTLGSTYKAVMESGFIVTVKRLKDSGFPRMEEFKRHIEILGRLKHSNLVPLRAYFQAKEECLLVYDYFPNGSLFSLIHGSKVSGSGKPLHWTSCLKIAEDLAMGLVYIHQNPSLTHGNLKSSNVLLGPDFESCITDYGLVDLQDPDSVQDTSAPSSLFYKAPECRDSRKSSTQPADVYSFGVLLLELLTGRTSFQDLVHEHGSDISRWVRTVREAETESGEELSSSEEKLEALLSIATACVAVQPEDRPVMREVLKMVKDARAEAAVFSSFSISSDHSPGRWSDTVQKTRLVHQTHEFDRDWLIDGDRDQIQYKSPYIRFSRRYKSILTGICSYINCNFLDLKKHEAMSVSPEVERIRVGIDVIVRRFPGDVEACGASGNQ